MKLKASTIAGAIFAIAATIGVGAFCAQQPRAALLAKNDAPESVTTIYLNMNSLLDLPTPTLRPIVD